MTVRELIIQLLDHDPTAEVFIPNKYRTQSGYIHTRVTEVLPARKLNEHFANHIHTEYWREKGKPPAVLLESRV